MKEIIMLRSLCCEFQIKLELPIIIIRWLNTTMFAAQFSLLTITKQQNHELLSVNFSTIKICRDNCLL